MKRIEDVIGVPAPAVLTGASLADAISRQRYMEQLGITNETNPKVAKRKLEAEKRRIEAGLDRVEAARRKHVAYLAALERFAKVVEGYQLSSHSNPTSILEVRRMVRAEFFQPMGDTNRPIPTREFQRAHWFDFRRLPISNLDDMIKCGKELVEAGIVRLPFEECVFVFPYVCKDGTEIVSACLLRQTSEIVALSVLHVYPTWKPLGLYGPDMPPNDPIFYALAVLSSKSVERRKCSVSTGTPVQGRYRGDSYFQVIIRENLASGEGRGHASPRLHWRRGHIRRLPNRTIWIRPMLVGVAENGVVIHDYAARMPVHEVRKA